MMVMPAAHPVAVMGCGGGNADGQDAQRDGGCNDLSHGQVSFRFFDFGAAGMRGLRFLPGAASTLNVERRMNGAPA